MPAALAGVVAVAAAVRIYDIVANPPGFFADEAAYGYNAYTILHTAKDEFGTTLPLFFESFGDYKTPVYIYSMIPFVGILGLSELPVRLTSALYGVMTVAAVYLLVKELFGQRSTALVAALILAISPWHIFYTRTGFGEIAVHVFFLVLALYFFLVGTRRPPFLLAAALALALALYSYRAAWIIAPLLLIVVIVLYRRELIQHWRFSLTGLFILALASVPILLLIFNVDERAQDRSILNLELGTWGTVERAIEHYVSYYKPSFLLDGTAETNLRHVIPGFGWIYLWQVPFGALGLAALAWRPTRPKLLVLSLLAVFPVAGAVTVESPVSARALFGSVAFAIVTAYGFVTAMRLLGAWRPSPRFELAGAGLAVVLLLGTGIVGGLRFGAFLDTYHGRYQENASSDWQWGGRAVVERFLEEESQYDRLWVDGGAFIRPDIFIRFYAPDGCANCHVTHEVVYQPELRHFYALRPGGPPWFEELGEEFEYVGEIYYPNGELAVTLVAVDVGVTRAADR